MNMAWPWSSPAAGTSGTDSEVTAMPIVLQTALLLIGSNVFMTFACTGVMTMTDAAYLKSR